MLDAYCHLDCTEPDPLADIAGQISTASLSGAFLIETWDGRTRAFLEQMIRDRNSGLFRLAFCYRVAEMHQLRQQINNPMIAGIRVSTGDLTRDQPFCAQVQASGKIIVAHAESGIGDLCRSLTRFYEVYPDAPVYVPHMGWPIRNGRTDTDWPHALNDMATMPNLTMGISAIAHFSREPFPHNDVRDFAFAAISQFPAARIVIGSNYPSCAKHRYADYIHLAYDWVRSIHSNWNDDPAITAGFTPATGPVNQLFLTQAQSNHV